jgi:ABC-2 type transport system ATP-binding protein
MATIVVRDLHKWYGGFHALRGISFEVAQGEVLAVLGPNGAGKTTTVEILQGFVPPSRGEVSVLGYEPMSGGVALCERIGSVLQSSALYDELTVLESVQLFAGYYVRPVAPREVIERVGLSDKEKVRVGALSGGEKRRLDFALAIVGDPDLLFLDEPTTGFDVEIRRKFWDDIAAFAASGKTVVLTTHYMEEAQRLADRVLVLNQGKIVAEGAPDKLGKPMTTIRFKLPVSHRLADLPEGLRAQVEAAGSTIILKAEAPDEVLGTLTKWAREQGIRLEQLEVSKPSLEEAYLELLASVPKEVERL